jgi:hypothetical protein
MIAIAPQVVEHRPYETAMALHLALKWATASQQKTTITEMLANARDLSRHHEEGAGFVSLFDGTTLKGWHGNLDTFRVEDGAIVGGSLSEPIPRNEFLRTDNEFGDFELRLQFKLLGKEPNAGVQIRTQEIPDDNGVSGYQADLGPGWWGCLYDESRRNRMLSGPPAEQRAKLVRENEWNDYRILCEGNRIRLWINGVQTVDYSEADPDIPLRGVIALQVHSGTPTLAKYRNLRIRECKTH